MMMVEVMMMMIYDGRCDDDNGKNDHHILA